MDIEGAPATIVCGKEILIGNRDSLCLYSKYFDRLLNGYFRESAQNVVKLDCDAVLLQRVLVFYNNIKKYVVIVAFLFIHVVLILII